MSPAEIEVAEGTADFDHLKSDAKDCISKCALLLDTSDEVLSQRNLGTQLVLWSCVRHPYSARAMRVSTNNIALKILGATRH